MTGSKLKTIFLLHLMLMVYSMSGICSKKAASVRLFSLEFCAYYGCIILLLGLYAIGWQQIIKRLPLTTAFANKAITIVWGIIWGFVFFHEAVTAGKVIGAGMVVLGIVMYAYADGEEKDE